MTKLIHQHFNHIDIHLYNIQILGIVGGERYVFRYDANPKCTVAHIKRRSAVCLFVFQLVQTY